MLFTIICQAVNKFLHALIKKKFLAEWQAMQAQIPPFIAHWQTDCLLQDLGEDQRGDKSEGDTSGLHGGCSETSKCRCWRVSTVQMPVCVEIQCHERLKTCFNSSAQHLFSIAGFRLSLSIS